MVTNMIEAEGRFINRPTKTGGRTYDKFFVYIPTEVARDGTFPFKSGEKVKVKIDVEEKRIIVSNIQM